jgi:hypothetical protein
VRRIHERAVVRAWEYRQREHAKGVWFRLRRALVDASRLFAISDVEADRLQAGGAQPLSVGRELAPEKRIFFVTQQQLETLEARELPVRISAEFLQAGAVVLLAHSASAREPA